MELRLSEQTKFGFVQLGILFHGIPQIVDKRNWKVRWVDG
jgi:hypothetical protein